MLVNKNLDAVPFKKLSKVQWKSNSDPSGSNTKSLSNKHSQN